jgi:hypothetical protein
MIKFLVAILLTAALAFVSGLYLNWWGIAIAAFLVALMVHQRAGKAFLAGFTGVFLLHGGLALWIDSVNDSLLSVKISELLPLGGSSILLVLVTAFIGGLLAGFAAMTASYLRTSKPLTI